MRYWIFYTFVVIELSKFVLPLTIHLSRILLVYFLAILLKHTFFSNDRSEVPRSIAGL